MSAASVNPGSGAPASVHQHSMRKKTAMESCSASFVTGNRKALSIFFGLACYLHLLLGRSGSPIKYATELVALLALISTGSACAQAFSGSIVDAVQITLRQEASVAASHQQISFSQGQLLSARAPFDSLWSSGISQQRFFTPIPGGAAVTSKQTTYSAGLSRKLESGVTLNPTVSINRIRDDAFNSTAPSISNVVLNVVIPLLKGAGTEVTIAPVKAAAFQVEASRSSFRYTQAEAVVRTTGAYWDLVAARQNLQLSSQAESRANELLANAKKLARADEIPKADLIKYEVRRVAQESDRLRAGQQVSESLQALSQAMNTPIETLEAAPRALDPFPKVDEARLAVLDDPVAIASLIVSSADRRADIQALSQRLRAANTLAEAAKRDSGSKLDLSVSIGYSGMAEGRSGANVLRAFGQPAPGLNAGISLNYTLPGNGFERDGLILQRNAAASQAQTDLDALRLRAAGEGRTQVDALRSTIAQLAKAGNQQALQAKIYENEKRSYQAGLSSLLDLFTNENQLTTYQIQWVQAQRDFAQALVLFRFKTGTLLPNEVDYSDDLDRGLIQTDTLTSLPKRIDEK